MEEEMYRTGIAWDTNTNLDTKPCQVATTNTFKRRFAMAVSLTPKRP